MHRIRPQEVAQIEEVELQQELDILQPVSRERENIVRILKALQNSEDFQSISCIRVKFERVLADARIKVDTSTLSRWIRGLKEDKTSLQSENRHGHRLAMSKEISRLMVGFVLHNNSVPNDVFLDTIQNFLKTKFNINVSIQTVINYCNENGLSYHETTIRANDLACEQIVNRNVGNWVDFHEECLGEYYERFPEEKIFAYQMLAAKQAKFVGTVEKTGPKHRRFQDDDE
jgi:transposase